ncbi:MAG: hypothetical protein ABW022_25135 [Actinoplanes sp.]
MSDTPVIHCTAEEMATERFWHEHLVPITAARGLPDPDQLQHDQGDPAQHLLLDPDGNLLAVVRTDRPACSKCGR